MIGQDLESLDTLMEKVRSKGVAFERGSDHAGHVVFQFITMQGRGAELFDEFLKSHSRDYLDPLMKSIADERRRLIDELVAQR
jgi:hypothetical protein